MSVMATHVLAGGNGSGYCPITNKTQFTIMSLLCKHKGLTVRQIARRLKRNYHTIYDELQKMKGCHQVIKDKEKRYFTNPKYGDYLIETGLRVIGMNNGESVTILKKRTGHLRKKVSKLERIARLLDQTIRGILSVSS